MKQVKKAIRKMPKRILSLLLVTIMAVNYFLPIRSVFASTPQNNGDYGKIRLNGVTSLQNVDNADTVVGTYEHGTVTITGSGLYSDGNDQIYALGDITVTATPSEGYTADLWENGSDLHTATKAYNNITATDIKTIDGMFNENQSNPNLNNNPNNNQGNTTANVTVSAGNGTYKIKKYVPEEGKQKEVDVAYDDETDFYINGSMWNHENNITYNSNSQDTSVKFTFETLWINRYYDNIVINGVSYNVSDYLDFDDRDQWLIANHGSQILSFDIPNVPKADSYNIVVKHGENNGKRYFATFLWTADPAQANGHDYIGHAKLDFVKAVYEVQGTTYTVTGDQVESNLVHEGNFDNYHSQDGFLTYGTTSGVNFDDGSLTLPGGALVTMRVVPEYGYQVTSVNGGNNFTTTESGVSEFTVRVEEGTAGYFQAEVTKVDDEVLANSQKVSSGSVEIANGEIDSGTVRLSVDDVQLSPDKINDFEDAVGSNYKINSYLDINLNNVLYKGSADDVWSKQIHHLDNEALITLKLEDGIDINDIVIVHNIDNGDKFEIIKIDSYDPKTNTITFRTKSFSNYAIAKKTSGKNAESTSTNKITSTTNPKTIDNIISYIIVLIISLFGLTYTGLALGKKVKASHNR